MPDKVSDSVFAAAPARPAPSLVESSDLRRAEEEILEWAEIIADEGRINASDTCTVGEAMEIIDTVAADISELIRLVHNYRLAKMNATMREVLVKTASALE